ncbi:MAG: Rab family GTPase, partial [Promethearchaeota archaeon]
IMPQKFILKILTAGEGGVGKTTLLHRYVEGKFSAETKMTIGVEFFLKETEVDSKQCTLQLWDFGGQERFRFLLESYVLGAKGALLMFDLTRLMSLENLQQWINIVRKGDPNLPVLFVGTKLDLVGDIQVDDDYAATFLKEFNLIDFIKISSKTGENVSKVFEILTRNILERQTY